VSAVFNILYIFGKADGALLNTGVIIVVAFLFVMSLTGIIIKNIRKEDKVSLNIFTPVKELGILYTTVLGIWTVSYFIVIFFR
jgi:hypothetical protein